MTKVDFFKQQAKQFFKDYNSRVFDENEGVYRYSPRFFNDIDDIILSYDIPEDGSFTLMNAQHIIAMLAGFGKWNELIKASEPRLELGKLLITNREAYSQKPECYAGIVDDWQMYEATELKRLNLDDEAKLSVFKEIFLSEEKEIKESKGRKIKLDFTNEDIAQDMIYKLMEKKRLTPEEAILSSITFENWDKVMSTGWASEALAFWGHASWGTDSYLSGKLENPIIHIKLDAKKLELIKIVKDIHNITYKTIILYFVLFELESLGYHI